MKRAVLQLVLDEVLKPVKAMGYRYQVAMWSAEWTAGVQIWDPQLHVVVQWLSHAWRRWDSLPCIPNPVRIHR